jgi:hypothetical protein
VRWRILSATPFEWGSCGSFSEDAALLPEIRIRKQRNFLRRISQRGQSYLQRNFLFASFGPIEGQTQR